MNYRIRLQVVLLLVLSLIAVSCAPCRTAESTPSTIGITILHVNDLHGHILPYIDKVIDPTVPVGDAACLAAMIDEERERNPLGTILLSAGDMSQGTPISNLFHGKPVIEIMNNLRFDAMTIGNHEFDWTLDVLEQMIGWAYFPFLSSNILTKQGTFIPGVRPYIMVERKGLKIAVIGVTTVETAYTTKPGNVKGLTFLDPSTVLPPLMKEVRDKGARIIVVLSHLGLNADKELASKVPGIDVIVGGHSHTAVTDPVIVNETIIVQAGCYDAYLGVLDLTIRKDMMRIVEATKRNELRPVLSGQDQRRGRDITVLIDRYNDRITKEFSRIVGTTSIDLNISRVEESNTGDLVCDAMRESTGAAIAFVNSGGLRIDIPKGAITMEKIFELLPYDNVIITMRLSGRQIRNVLEQSARIGHGGMLQVSGIRMTFDMKQPEGSRVRDIQVGTSPLRDDEQYAVAINDFLAAGGDNYVAFKEGTAVQYGDELRDAFVSYLEKHSPVSPLQEGRIHIVK
ncbi:MAG: bifunctional metallophosphatase/5'-nucleotidase [Deltaproteobacteria bacterium]|nr:bifunctional metallophosphatase/5'-nucleotidase [Deltaproteobacteria bacterium]